MNQALYRKYRSKSFEEVIGQDHVTQTLQKAIKSGRISHAYLFTGPRGVGKTTVARILAREANNFQFDGESAHLDIIEIDAASNRRIDEIRDLRDRVRITPVSGRYKVYIIDEVHMLTKEAFNALLKTLEEPPAHIIFILATTEAHKLPETIISRTQRFEFKPIPAFKAARQLADIAKQEKIEVTPEAIGLLAAFGDGSFRDSIGYLDQLASSGSRITEADVREVLGWPSQTQIEDILAAVNSGETEAILTSLQQLKDSGVDAATIASSLSMKIRQEMLGNARLSRINLLKQLLEVPISSRPYDRLELSLLEAALNTSSSSNPNTPLPTAKKENKNSEPAVISPSKTIISPIKKFDANPNLVIEKWPKVVDAAKQRAASIYTALKLADPQYEDGVLVLKFKFPLHQKKLAQADNKALISGLIEEITGMKVKIECIVDKSSFAAKEVNFKKPVSDDGPGIHSISSIFGNSEVLES